MGCTQRQESLKLFNLAKKAGLIESPKECKICGQAKGILMTHNKNYDVTLSYLPKFLTVRLMKWRLVKFTKH